MRELQSLTSKIVPVDHSKVITAALLSRPTQLIAAGLDPRHIRTGTSRRWVEELRQDIAQVIAETEPFASACVEFGYDWDTKRGAPPFDYDAISPIRGRGFFERILRALGTWSRSSS